jgi:type VI secretion system secreted protein VgrG
MSSQSPKVEAEVVTALPDETFILRKLTGTETLSRGFEFRVEVLSPNEDVDFTQLVGRSVSVKVMPAGDEARLFNGVILRIGKVGTQERYVVYEMIVVPWFRLLQLTRNCRVRTETTTDEVVREVLGAHSWSYSLENPGTHRDCCVQYRESDWAFVSRLLEEEGAYYFFVPEGNDHEMTIRKGDSPATDHVEAHFKREGQGHDEAEQVTEFRFYRELVSDSWEMVDFLYGDPVIGDPAETAVSRASQDGAPSLSVFDFPEQYGKYTTGASNMLEDWVKVRAAQSDARSAMYQGKSNVWALLAGHGMSLKDHFDDAVNADYLVTEVRHTLTFSGAMEAGQFEESSYSNEFVCIPDGVEFRPQETTPKPRIHGVQSAVVADAIDDQARIRVEFPWAKDQPSWWVRVSQAWAGAGWGHQFHPRVGQEVLVTFLNGDPDLPVVVGRVYNGANEGPYSGTHSQGGVKTRSMEGGAEDFNEIRFEDDKGSEEILVHAQKQLTVSVEADEARTVGGSRSEQVEKDVSIRINGSRSESVEGKRALAVGGNKEESVGGAKSVSVSKDHTETVEGAMKVDVAKDRKLNVGKAITDAAGTDVSVSSGKAMSHSAGTDAKLSVGGEWSVTVAKDAKIEISKDLKVEGKKIQIEGKDEIVLKCGSAKIIMKKNGDIVIDGKKIDVKGSGDVKIKGSKASVQ